jgi:choline dehydrogenase
MDTFDYVIVGAGTAGCILANRLSADADVTVCVLEAGPRDWHPYIHIPAGFIKLFHQPKLNWLYTQEPSEWTGGRRILAPRGKTLGGSSSINGHIYNRGQRGDYDGWAQRGNRNWGYADVLPYFKRLEKRIGEGDEVVPRPRRRAHHHRHRLSSSAERGLHCRRGRDGHPAQPGLQRRKSARHQLCATRDPQGRRVSAARAFLRPAMKRPNLEVRTKVHATGLIFEGKRAAGIRYRKGGRNGPVTEVRARREVILSGGTFNSPQLLQLSGVGEPEFLQSKGIAVHHALRGVGENLRDHYAPRVSVRVKNIDTINERSRGMKLAAEIFRWCTGGKSILGLSPTQGLLLLEIR